MAINFWAHIAWVKKSTDANNIYVWVNGVTCGTIPCGANAFTTSDWSSVTIGNILSQLNCGFNFKGRIGGLRVSNTAVHNTDFTPPSAFNQQTSTVLLLSQGSKEKISNATLTENGTIAKSITASSFYTQRPT